MRFNATLVGVLLTVSNPLTATTVKGVIRENERGGSGLANVEVSAIEGANPVRSLADGKFVLDFPNNQPGEKVVLIVNKRGWAVVNEPDLEFNLPKGVNADPLIVLLCQKDELPEWRRRYYRLDPIEQKFQKQLEELRANQATEAAMERLRLERDQAKEAEQRNAEGQARVKSAEVSEFLVLSMPPVYRSDAPVTLNNLGIKYRRQNRMQDAQENFEKALEISRSLAERNRAAYLPDVVESLNNLGNLLGDRKRNPDEALKYYDEALELSCELVKGSPATYLPDVAATRNNRAILHRRQNRMDEARKDFDEALKLYDGLAQLNPATYQPLKAETLANLGLLNHEQSQLKEAQEVFSEALAIYESLERKNPGQYAQEVESTYDELLVISRKLAQQNSAYLPDLAEMLINRGNSFSDQNRMPEAWNAYDEALEILSNLGQQNISPRIALILRNLGSLNHDHDRMEEAHKALSKALAIYEALPGQYTQQVESTRRLLDDIDRRRP